MTPGSTNAPGNWGGSPRVIAQGVLDGDAIVYELFPLQTVFFDGRAGTIESIPFPIVDTTEYPSAVLSLMTRSISGFISSSRVRLRVQNAVQSCDDPAQTFAANVGLGLTIDSSDVVPGLNTIAISPLGPGARLVLEWQQASTVGMVAASARFALWLTLRRA